MLLLVILLPLAAMLQQSLGQDGTPIISDISEEQQKMIVDKHNDYRRAVTPTASNMLKMVWSVNASETAKKWAKKCRIETSPIEERVVDGKYCGENSMQSGFLRTWSDVVAAWYEAKSNFKYGVGAIDPNTSIDVFSQVIWHNSYQTGCAVSFCQENNDYFFFYVCHYCPAGNIVDKMATPYKQGLPCEDCPNNCEDKLCTNPCKYVDNVMDCDKLVRMFDREGGKCPLKWLEKECEATCKCTSEII